MRTLLMVMHARQIPECETAISSLKGIDIAWLTGYTESQLVQVIADLIESTDYDRYSVISDDASPSQAALDLVLHLHDEHPQAVTCGIVNVDEASNLTTYNPQPLTGTIPALEAYSLTPYYDLLDLPPVPLRTYFHGMALATMTRSLWQRFPFGVFGEDSRGWASDFHQCLRLQAASIPILTHKHAFIRHHKAVANQSDPTRPLLVGSIPQSVAIVGDTPAASQGE